MPRLARTPQEPPSLDVMSENLSDDNCLIRHSVAH